MANPDSFARPCYLLAFTEGAGEGLLAKVKEWLQEGGLQIDVEGSADERSGQPAFVVVTAGRDQLEDQAERLGFLKMHTSLKPYVQGQDFGKMEFDQCSREWCEGYKDYGSGEFWQPCERAQLLRAALDQIPARREELQALKVTNEAALSVTQSLVAALKIACLLEVVVPLDDDAGAWRRSVWKAGRFLPLSPADMIQHYFGSYVAMYFAWMNSFTRWLLAPAAVGLACSLHMQAFGYCVDDHPYLPLHSLFVVLWSVAFVCNWDRTSAEKAWQWNVLGEERQEEIRAQFHGELRTSRVTGLQERHIPYAQRAVAYALSVAVTASMLCIAFFAMICSLNLQGYMEEHVTSFEKAFYIAPLAKFAHPGAFFDPNQTEYFGLLAFGPTLLHVFVIMQLNKCYRFVAEWLTETENHMTLEHHENSLVAKRFIFEAFDCYISLFYVGFVQQDMRKLRSELVSLYTVDSLRRVCLETLAPLAIHRFNQKRISEQTERLKKHDRADCGEALEALIQPEYEQFDDFLEMVIEFGYVTLFASAFPLAGVLSIACNLIELKSDLFKLCWVYQRPAASRAATIGVWRLLLQVIVLLSIMTNVMIFSMSEQLASWAPWLYREATEKDVLKGRLANVMDEAGGTADLVIKKGAGRYVVLAAFSIEHIVGIVALVMVATIPRCPEWVCQEVRRMEWYKKARFKEQRRQHGSDAR